MSIHRIIDMPDQTILYSGEQSARNFIVGKSILPNTIKQPDNIPDLERTIAAYEMAAADYWQFAFDTNPKNASKKAQFHTICRECANMMAICPVPSDPLQKMIHVLKMFAYAYLGEKWEDIRRYITENESIWDIKPDADPPWDYRLFSGIYEAILHLGQKKSRDDLSAAANIIDKLRDDQKKFEKEYLDNAEKHHDKSAALQLLAMYHLAKAVEVTSSYMASGTPYDIVDHLELHFRNAQRHSRRAGTVELDLILIMMFAAFKKMARNSIWVISRRVNSKVDDFVRTITESDKPIFELLYPQRLAILERGLLDPASRAIVVNLPTSSGNTLMAEFRILQALNMFGDNGVVVYVVPTRTLVNQVTARLRRDLGAAPLGVRVTKMSGAIKIDSFEESVLGEQKEFDILVTTPEKLQLLLRHPQRGLADAIRLAIIDKAHNMADNTRGLNLEILISTIGRECKDAHLLLLTPSIPNSEDIAQWLDPQNPKSISLEFAWKPNDSVVGMYYAKGHRKSIKTFFEPLTTSGETISIDKKITIGQTTFSLPIHKIKDTKYALTALLASQLDLSKGMLVLGQSPAETWRIARLIYDNIDDKFAPNDKVRLVKRFIESELGQNFPLVSYLERGIGVHHAGLSEEIRQLIEWLMESGSIKILVATATIAQETNFPVSGILISTYNLGRGAIPSRDFWNLLGRAGRIDQPSIGVVGLAVTSKEKSRINTTNYVKRETDKLVSTLPDMVNEALKTSAKLDLSFLARHPQWSTFVQYVAHVKNRSDNLEKFLDEAELALQRTYGYGQLDTDKQRIVLEAVRDYARILEDKPNISQISDLTGFAPETIKDTMASIKRAGIKPEDWAAPTLFSAASGKMSTLVDVMRKDIHEVKDVMNIKVGKNTLTNDTIGKVISEWVAGRNITDIATDHFGDGADSITDCMRAIYTRIINGATWGMAGMQKILESGLDDDIMTDEDKKRLASLPAMIYYGVNTEESVLMRTHSVPRRIAGKLGRAYKVHNDIYNNTSSVIDWLDNLDVDAWRPSSGGNMTGSDYKRVWRQLSGVQGDS